MDQRDLFFGQNEIYTPVHAFIFFRSFRRSKRKRVAVTCIRHARFINSVGFQKSVHIARPLSANSLPRSTAHMPANVNGYLGMFQRIFNKIVEDVLIVSVNMNIGSLKLYIKVVEKCAINGHYLCTNLSGIQQDESNNRKLE